MGTSRAAFVAASPHLFLVKRPTAGAGGASAPAGAAISYKTQHIGEAELIDDATFAGRWWVAPIRKRPGNPFPDRVSLGRAPNCDVVLRASFVSKLHAHFPLDHGHELRLCDQRSANGTSVNGRELIAGVATVVRSGDRLRFGAVELELMDAGSIYDRLAADQG